MLLLHRHMPAVDVVAGLTAALRVGATQADVVAVEARKQQRGATQPEHPVGQDDSAGQRVVSLTERRLSDPTAVIAGLPPDSRPLPSVDRYDELLTRRKTAPPAADLSKGNVS